MKPHVVIAAAIAIATISVATARTRTTQTSMRTTRMPVERMLPDTANDNIATNSSIDPSSVTLQGFSKRASDAKESFFVTNHTMHRLSAVRLLLRYTSLSGQMLHERHVTVPVSLKPSETQLVSVKTFDIQRQFYYYLNAKPRKQATPFRVAYRLVGFDITVGGQ